MKGRRNVFSSRASIVIANTNSLSLSVRDGSLLDLQFGFNYAQQGYILLSSSASTNPVFPLLGPGVGDIDTYCQEHHLSRPQDMFRSVSVSTPDYPASMFYPSQVLE